MIVTLTGTNDFARASEMNKLVEEFLKSYDEFGLERVDASSVELSGLIDSVSSVPFLTERRMVVLFNISTNKYLADEIERVIKSVADSTDLVIDDRKLDKRSSFYKTLKKQTDLREFKDLDEGQLARWLVSEATARGGNISLVDARYLVDRVGVNQMMISNELDKLLSFDPSIGKDTIDELVSPNPSSSMFDLLDAAFSGDRSRAIRLYEDQRRQQVEPQAIMGMIGWQVHVLAVVSFNQDKGVDYIARNSSLNPYVIKKTMRLTERMSKARIRSLVEKTLELDFRLKTQSIDADDAIQYLLLTI